MMKSQSTDRLAAGRLRVLWLPQRSEQVTYLAIAASCVLLFWLSAAHPALMPVWAPWDFSAPIFLATALTLFWFFRGLGLQPEAARPPIWRRVVFLVGMVLTYAVLQTRFEYWSQHMFFLNRIQHVVMHHLGPMLIALGFAGGTIKCGMPAAVRRLTEIRPVGVVLRVLQQPVVAGVLFVGSFFFWLIPAVHFRAMIDWRLYALMNWTMVLDGILFWSLVLDPRPKPPARVSFGTRIALAVIIIFPQIVVGALITFSETDLYPYYDFCGRLFPSVTALNDQHYGGIAMWIPPAMMSLIAMLFVLNAVRLSEHSKQEDSDEAERMAAMARRWTGQ